MAYSTNVDVTNFDSAFINNWFKLNIDVPENDGMVNRYRIQCLCSSISQCNKILGKLNYLGSIAYNLFKEFLDSQFRKKKNSFNISKEKILLQLIDSYTIVPVYFKS